MRANFKEVSRWLMSGGLLLAGTFAHGNTITINSDGDAPNANVFGTSCNTGGTVTIPGAGTVPECTLRAAIQVANNLSSSTIQYASALSCSDLNQIRLQSSLPGIGSPLVVDASTHPCAGGSANWYPTIIPDIVSGATINFGLTIGADNVTIERMEFGFFEIAGILVDGNNVTLDNVQSSLNGLGLVFSGADGGLVINSTFSNNDGDNVRLSSSQGVALRNNWISSSDWAGIAILNGSSGNSIGSLSGTPPASNCQGNSIFSNAESGIFVDSDSDGQVIVCNTIFSNEGNGITLESDDNRVGSAADLGELDISPMGNIIRSNDGNGIQMGMNSHGNIISRNIVGGEAGESSQGNALNGIVILGGNGGIQEINENTIGYNGLDGIRSCLRERGVQLSRSDPYVACSLPAID